MIAQNPFDLFRQECQTALASRLGENSARDQLSPQLVIKKTPNVWLWPAGDFAVFRVSKDS